MESSKITLSAVIMNKLRYPQIEQNVLRYFLEKNIIAVFGKDKFEKHEIEIELGKSIHEITEENESQAENTKVKRNSKVLLFRYAGSEYIVATKEDLGLYMANESNLVFRIQMKDQQIENLLVAKTEEKTITEYQRINMNDKVHFDYKKIIVNGEEKIESPTYRVSAIGARKGNNEYFEIKTLDKEPVVKGLFNRIKNNNIFTITDYLNTQSPLRYIADIYQVIEARCEEDILTSKYSK